MSVHWGTPPALREDALARVRGNVLARVERARRASQMRWLAAMAASIAIALFAWQYRMTPEIEKLSLQLPEAPAAPAIGWVRSPVVKTPPKARLSIEVLADGMKIQTPDPSVAIVLVGDGGTE